MTGLPDGAMDAAVPAFTKIYNRTPAPTIAEALDAVQAALEAAAPVIVAAERERLARVMREGFEVLDNDTRATLAPMMVRWAAAITDDPAQLSDIAALLDRPGE
jgi:hypothetical protein